VGTTTVVCKASDSRGNVGTASFTIRVNPPRPLFQPRGRFVNPDPPDRPAARSGREAARSDAALSRRSLP
jgi:hypothetical protein